MKKSWSEIHPAEHKSCVVVGASAGGIQALSELVQALPPDFNRPLVCVIHLHPNSKNSGFIYKLQQNSQLNVKEADEKEPLCDTTIYLAPANYHMLIEDDYSIALSVDAKVNFSRPAIDPLFVSAAQVYRQNLVAILLSGASSDGVLGLEEVKRWGGTTIAQLPQSAQAPYMPQSAIDNGHVDKIMTPTEIGHWFRLPCPTPPASHGVSP
jgi:two-component system chemotaxis response regulator CheB